MYTILMFYARTCLSAKIQVPSLQKPLIEKSDYKQAIKTGFCLLFTSYNFTSTHNVSAFP